MVIIIRAISCIGYRIFRVMPIIILKFFHKGNKTVLLFAAADSGRLVIAPTVWQADFVTIYFLCLPLEGEGVSAADG